MPSDAKRDMNLVSQEKHELDYLLNKWDKAVNESNREILTGWIRKFKADGDWAPHNRERFYEYVGLEGVLELLADKEADTVQATIVTEAKKEVSPGSGPATVLLDSEEEETPYTGPATVVADGGKEKPEAEETTAFLESAEEETPPAVQATVVSDAEKEESPGAGPATVVGDDEKEKSPYTVVKAQSAPRRKDKTPQEKKKKGILIPLLLILCALIAAGVLVYFLVFSKPQAQPALADKEAAAEETALAEEEAGVTAEEETGAALVENFKQVLSANTPLLFVADQAVLLPGEEAKLQKIAGSLKELKKADLTVTGHTANIGYPEGELAVSEQRAAAVKSYFVQNSTGPELAIKTVGKGATEPVVKDVPPMEQQANRRVEITLNKAE